MNIAPASTTDLLDGQNRAREEARKRGTSIQDLLPVSGPGGPLDAQNTLAGTDTAPDLTFDTLVSTVIDTVNPLQHIPGVSSVYESATGDTMNPIASMAGGFLFGGPVGLIAGAASSFLELMTGKSIGQHAQALLSGDSQGTNKDQTQQTIAQIGDGNPMVQTSEPLSLKNYQAFAATTAEQNSGIGAEANSVAWATTSWTAQALKQATGIYEANQTQQSKRS